MCTIRTGCGDVSYAAVREAVEAIDDDHFFEMSLVGREEIDAVIAAVNQGIDAHLEACNCPDRGDVYEGTSRKIGDTVVARPLEARVSKESLPVLMRRLCEDAAAGDTLVCCMLTSLGFDESLRYVGREALGLD